MAAGQVELFEEIFRTARPANPIFCHLEFLEKLGERSKDAVGKRATLLLQRLAVDERRLHYKATYGPNRGWRRSRLGGNSGNHFYAWWAPQGAPPIKESAEFASAPQGSIFLRDIRHHDDHTPLRPQSLQGDYLPVAVTDLRQKEYGPEPWTPQQERFASARSGVRLLKGHPGSGKTTALWHAADTVDAEKVLYVTYSRDLAALARDYFDRYCSVAKTFHVVTFPSLLREALGRDVERAPERESRQRFRRDLAPYQRSLGPWQDDPGALWEEMHAHLVGDAVPAAAGRFVACSGPRVADKAYRERRTRYLGTIATASLLDIASRLEKQGDDTLADRYFPELAHAWHAVGKLRAGQVPPEWENFDCIAVDECQDLTPIETMILVELARSIQQRRRGRLRLLLAGDEAQTVRPTDFEWGWLSDLLHAHVGTPQEFKLSTNLRSPRRIADLVNRAWDLYGHLEKQDRPSGSGYAEIEDDATDEIFYCTAAPGPDLDRLLAELASREGLAILSFDEEAPRYVPESLRPSVLSVSEAKGLDFHSVCVLDAGKRLERVTRFDTRARPNADIEALRKRLAIDQLRVALSRPAERLFWIDVSPSDQVVRESLQFLNRDQFQNRVAACIPEAVLKTLEEDQLDLEERILRCQADARQFLEVRPEIALSRAQQAVTLLGKPGSIAAVVDGPVRDTAYRTLAEVSFCLAFRRARLAPEMGRPDLFVEARQAASGGGQFGLSVILGAIQNVQEAAPEQRLSALADLAETLPRHKDEVAPWLLVEIETKARQWVEELESAMFSARHAVLLSRILPPFCVALGVPDAAERAARLRQKSVQILIKDRAFGVALDLLLLLPERQPKLEAVCYEGLRDYAGAARCHRDAGNLKEALHCCRRIPDFEATLQLVRQIGEHPAAESLEWVARLRELVAQRPEKFHKMMTPEERGLLQEILERALGVARRKMPPRKPAVKKTARSRPAASRSPSPAG